MASRSHTFLLFVSQNCRLMLLQDLQEALCPLNYAYETSSYCEARSAALALSQRAAAQLTGRNLTDRKGSQPPLMPAHLSRRCRELISGGVWRHLPRGDEARGRTRQDPHLRRPSVRAAARVMPLQPSRAPLSQALGRSLGRAMPPRVHNKVHCHPATQPARGTQLP